MGQSVGKGTIFSFLKFPYIHYVTCAGIQSFLWWQWTNKIWKRRLSGTSSRSLRCRTGWTPSPRFESWISTSHIRRFCSTNSFLYPGVWHERWGPQRDSPADQGWCTFCRPAKWIWALMVCLVSYHRLLGCSRRARRGSLSSALTETRRTRLGTWSPSARPMLKPCWNYRKPDGSSCWSIASVKTCRHGNTSRRRTNQNIPGL